MKKMLFALSLLSVAFATTTVFADANNTDTTAAQSQQVSSSGDQGSLPNNSNSGPALNASADQTNSATQGASAPTADTSAQTQK